jgi:type 1 glutamine amidotransferase
MLFKVGFHFGSIGFTAPPTRLSSLKIKTKRFFMRMNISLLALTLGTAIVFAAFVPDQATGDEPKRVVLIAGKPSHPPRMHEFNAGVQLLANCVKNRKDIKMEFVLNGWPKDESILSNADAVVFYMDGGGRHEAVLEEGRRLQLIQKLVDKGVGIGCMHYAVEIVPNQAGKEFKRWIGGHYENMFSCNPIWEPSFTNFAKHPITNGVKPFTAKDEWYFNMRFVADIPGNERAAAEEIQFVPILVASPSDVVRDGPYVSPKGPYPHIVANKGRAEAMMWAVERANGGRGFGFTGGHFHDNWGNDSYRKVVLNAMLWLAKVEVPANGVESSVSAEQLEANLDPKPAKK